ncbi:hypothetical protein BSPLISOX_941 [uncultured Gammaproteobacteria bacterium]|jgi:hypothetical protein|nr:hypothetical protein [uncultured Gammaproteobacteria bacterium]CAC9440183.1 hypothetical protein [uncultured Gammaproteobacteria bacterium]VVH64698.1 hypothetical protein BSPLISOX_941 [uncultured Gammaproteobacteria bacterium]
MVILKNSLPRSCDQARECVLYTVLSELMSNADAKKTSIEFQNNPKSIMITDEGNGISIVN